MADSSKGAEYQVRPIGPARRHAGAAREWSAYLLIAGFVAILAAALNAFGIPLRRPTAILFLLTIVLSGLFWGRWPPIIVAIGGVLFIDYFLTGPPGAFSAPSWRETILLSGLLAAGLAVGALSERMSAIRQKVRALAESGQLLKMLLREGAGAALVVVLALALNAFRAPPGRLVVIGPFFLIIGLTALLWGGRPASVAAIVAVIMVDYFFFGRPNDFSAPSPRETALSLGLLAGALLLGTFADHMREARREARRLTQSDRLQRTLLRVISHDLKTPLTTIMGSLQTSLDQRLNLKEETRRELVTIAYDQANRLNRLVTGILEMTQLETGAVGVRREPCQLADVVHEALGQLHETLHEHQCQITLPPSLPAVKADLVLLSHALANLLHNAAKFSPSASPIEITAVVSDGDVMVSVADRGPGIPAGDLDRVFEKFYGLRRSPTQPSSMGGAGLGLAVAKGIVEAHGGRIWAEQREGGGTIIMMSLPLT